MAWQVLRILLGLGLAILAAFTAAAALGLPLVTRISDAEMPIVSIARSSLAYLPFLGAVGLSAVALGEAARYRQLLYWLLAGAVAGMIGFYALRFGGQFPADVFGGRAPAKFVGMGAVAGFVYWLVAGRLSGGLAALFEGEASGEGHRRCTACAMAWMLLGLLPLGLVGWQMFQNYKAQLPAGTIATAERASAAAAAADVSAATAGQTEAERHAAEISAKRKADEEAQLKAEEEAARQKAEAERLAAEADAKRKADEEAARQKAEAERLAAEAEAKRKAEEEQAARQKAEAERLAAEIEAKRKAEEEAQLKAEAEAEAKRQAEEAARREAEAARLAADAAAKQAVAEELMRQTKTAAAEPQPGAQQPSQPAVTDTPDNPDSPEAIASRAALETCAADLEKITARRKIFFRSASADLRHIHAKILDAVAALAKRCPDLGIMVSGHTDATGNPQMNQQLSEDRAEAVRAALVERGVDSKQLDVRAYADRQPVGGVMRPYPRAADRRAEITPGPRRTAAEAGK